MKFTDGSWRMQKGVQVAYPAEAYDIESRGERSLTVYAPTRPIVQRGDMLGGAVLTVRFSSPLPDVIRVQIAHFTGGHEAGPDFPLLPTEDVAPSIVVADDAASLTSGRLTARIARGTGKWSVDFVAEDGRVITRSGHRGMGYAQVAGDGSYVHEQLALQVGELVYGLGERFTAFAKNGQTVDIWNQDGGTGSDLAYKNVPFYLTNRGYGVFVRHPGRVSFEVASEKVSRVQFSVPGESLEYFVIYGPTPKEVLEKYTALTGRPALLPPWSFGLWLTSSFLTSHDEETVTGFIQGMADRDLPLSVFHFDPFWMRGFHWCDFEWDPDTFPDPPAMLRRLHERGLRVCLWINPYITQRSRLFEEGKQGGYLLRRPNGDVWQWDHWQPGMAFVDFTNPEAARWFGDHLRRLVDMGVDCFKTDFGERIPLDVAWFDGSDPERMHNYYAYLYNQVVFEVLEEKRGKGEVVLFARSATAGSQRFPLHWGGDCSSNFESMAESLRGGLSLALCGFGFWSHDIGGFEGMPPSEVYKRWLPFGLLSSHSRLHGAASYRVPWLFDEEAVDTLRHFTHLKYRLMPYLFSEAVKSTQTGVPMMRPMLLEFPGDPACDYLDRQYMLGESLLVAPVFSSEGTVDYYVPEGRWTEFATGREVVGPGWVRGEKHDFLSVPLLVRPNTVLAVGARTDRPDYDYAADVELRVYALDEGCETTVTIPDAAGDPALSVRVWRQNGEVKAEADRPGGNWRLKVIGENIETA
jgi:alpha-D-xyloside xylohydrolase